MTQKIQSGLDHEIYLRTSPRATSMWSHCPPASMLPTAKGRINLFRLLCIQSVHDSCRITFLTLYLLAPTQNQDVLVQLVPVMTLRLGHPPVHALISTLRRLSSLEIVLIDHLTTTETLLLIGWVSMADNHPFH